MREERGRWAWDERWEEDKKREAKEVKNDEVRREEFVEELEEGSARMRRRRASEAVVRAAARVKMALGNWATVEE